MSTPPPEGPEGQGPSAAGQAASDGKDVAKAALKGAAVGGLAGAARGAAVAAVKSKTGRNIAIGSLVAFALAMVMVINVIAAGLNSFGFEEIRASATSAVVEKEVANEDWVRAAKEAGNAHGVEWQLLVAIHVLQDSRKRDKGTGPYGIDMAAVEEQKLGISEEDAQDLDRSANFIARHLASALATTDTTLTKSNLMSGAEFTDSEENGVDFHESESDEGKEAYEEARRHHIAAIETLPIMGNPQIAQYAWDTARSWTLGKQSQCLVITDPDLVPQTTVNMTDQQKVYAQQVINAVAVRGMDQRAAVVALATVMQESKFRMYWNPKVPGSRELTDDESARGVDGYSVGLFQQQVNGNAFAWGTVEDAMSPSKSTDMFLDALQRIGGWEDMSISQAAQAVQRSAHPDLYGQWESMARQLVDDLWPGGPPAGHDDVHSEPMLGTREDGSHLSVNPLATMDLKSVEQAVKDRFGKWVYSMGDYRADGDHARYLAVDLMIADYKSPAGVASGDSIAQFFIDNATAFGIEYLIWQDKIWLGPMQGWKPYSTGGYGGMYTGNWNDTTRHMDHVHVNVYGNKGTGGDLVYTPPEDAEANVPGCPPSDAGGIGPGEPGNGDDYPFREPVGVCAWCSNVDAGGSVDPWSLYKRECVSFVAWRINQQMGWKEGQPYPFTPAAMGLSLFGNAAEWSGNLRSAGFVTDNNPTKGSIAWWDAYASNASLSTGAAGHVGIVTGVDRAAGTVTIEQYNLVPWEYSVMTIPIAHVTGFIHVADIKEGTNNGPVKAV